MLFKYTKKNKKRVYLAYTTPTWTW